jgi:phage gp36-like protein
MPTQYATVAELDSGINASALVGVDSTTKTNAIVDASSRIDSYLGSHREGAPMFILPLLAWGGDLRRACINIAIYWIMVGRGYNPDAGSDPGIRDRYDDEIRWLELIAKGIVTPSVVDSSLVSGGGVGGAGLGSGLFGSPLVISSASRGFSSRGDPNGRTAPFQGDDGWRGPLRGD